MNLCVNTLIKSSENIIEDGAFLFCYIHKGKSKALELNRNEFIIYLLYLLGQVSSPLSKNWAVTYLRVL